MKKYFLLQVCIFLLTIVFLIPSLDNTWFDNSLSLHDWDQHFFYLESVRKAIVDFKEIPFWNPYYVGGIPILENPQVKFFTPTNIISIFIGSIKALKFSIILYYIVGALSSVFLFYRVCRLGFYGTMFSSSLFLFCGWHTQHIYAGHSQFQSVFILPFITGAALLYIKNSDKKYLVFGALGMALMLSDGNIYFFLFAIFILTVTMVGTFILNLESQIFQKVVLFIALSILFGAYRLIPETHFFFNNGAYFMPDKNYLKFIDIFQIFTGVSQHPYLARNIENQQYSWWEYGAYIGLFPFISFILLLVYFKKKDIPILFLALFVICLMIGNFHFLSPGNLLSYIPGFTNIRCSARWGIVFILIFSILWGQLINRFYNYVSKKNHYSRFTFLLLHLFLIIAFGYFYSDLTKKNAKNLNKIFSIPWEQIYTEKQKELTTVSDLKSYGASSSLLKGIFSNQSIRDGYENLFSNRNLPSIGEKIYRGEFYLLNKNGNLKLFNQTMNTLKFSIELFSEDTLVINRNFSSHWKVHPDLQILNYNGLMSVKLPKGKHSLEFYFYNYFFLLGLIVTFFSAFAAIVPRMSEVCRWYAFFRKQKS